MFNRNKSFYIAWEPEITPQNGGVNICVVRFHFWVGFEPILKYRSFWPVFGLFSLEHGQRNKSAVLQLKMHPNQKIEENKSALELNFTLKYQWAGHNFEFGSLQGNITEP